VKPRILGYREAQVLRLVEADLAERGAVRSYGRIAAELGMCGRNAVCNVIGRLERRGLVCRIRRGPSRSIMVRTRELPAKCDQT